MPAKKYFLKWSFAGIFRIPSITILYNKSDKYKNSLDYLRCKARLFTEQGKFAEAGGLWAKVAGMEKRRSSTQSTRNAQWWRAKYYELYCFKEMPTTKGRDVVHGIEILENGFGEIPPFWAERLKSLKTAATQGQ